MPFRTVSYRFVPFSLVWAASSNCNGSVGLAGGIRHSHLSGDRRDGQGISHTSLPICRFIVSASAELAEGNSTYAGAVEAAELGSGLSPLTHSPWGR